MNKTKPGEINIECENKNIKVQPSKYHIRENSDVI